MPVTIIHKYAQIGTLTLDATLSEQHEYATKVTQYPVETGASISDHIYNDPIKVTIHGIISNHPIPDSPNVNYYPNFAEYAFNELIAMRDKRSTVSLVTGLVSYTDMALQNLSIPRNVKNADALEFTASFVKIVMASVQTVPQEFIKPELQGKIAKKINKGAQTPAEVPVSVLAKANQRAQDFVISVVR